VDTPGYPYDIAISGTQACVADNDHGLQVIDISDPTSPTIVGNAPTPGYAYGVAVSQTHAYVAAYDYGIQIIDIITNARFNSQVQHLVLDEKSQRM